MNLLIPYLALIVAIIGLILYLATEAKPSEIGRICFFAGLLAWLLSMAK